jgi:hypothetical protein
LAPNFKYGSLLHVSTSEGESPPAALTPELQQIIESMTQQLQSQNEELLRRAQQEQELRERLDKEIEDRRIWQARMDKYFSSGNQTEPPPSPPHYGTGSHAHASNDSSHSESEEDYE